MWKPFKPPLLNAAQPKSENAGTEIPRPRKKRRVSSDDEYEAIRAAATIATKSTSHTSALPRQPLLTVNRNVVGLHDSNLNSYPEGYYTVLWRKPSAKKNITWDGDGVLVVRGGYAYLTDISGREMGKSACKAPLLPESELSVGGKVIQVESVISKEEYLSGKTFLGSSAQKPPSQDSAKPKPIASAPMKPIRLGVPKSKDGSQGKASDPRSKSAVKADLPAGALTTKFRAPLITSDSGPAIRATNDEPVPRHNPKAENALVMKRPLLIPKNKRVVDVVVDPILTKHLRDHQRAGVAFLYECVMGLRDSGGEGAVLADEMGLGKTLQTIALLWTLMKQNPVYEDPPVVRKALIVCPASVVSNWRREIWKWLGKERLGVFILDDNRFSRITHFTTGSSYQVMIVGYEKLRNVKDELAEARIDIVVCDEGHRLKTEKNLSAQAIRGLSTEKRIVLTGTPMQNNLGEYFFMIDLVNPGLLGKYSTFKRQFEEPINRSMQPTAHSKDIEKGQARHQEFIELANKFTLRRTADVLAKYLPPKTEYVLFLKPTQAQATLYRNAVGISAVGAVLQNSQAALALIQSLSKLCNSPRLMPAEGSEAAASNPGAKLQLLNSLLHHIRQTSPEDKVVIVSNYTSTLDIIQGQLGDSNSLRLDGSTPVNKRSGLVDEFNRTSADKCFVFLLSAKAGGVGLNLVGANRLILFDIAWNPAVDLQAMGRIHRDGQRRPCYIYRFLVKGAMDEKIYQRQVNKRSLADSIVDSKTKASDFTQDDLRDLFSFDETRDCATHDLLGCLCEGDGAVEPASFSEQIDANEGDEDGSSETELPEVGAFMRATQYDHDETERRIKAGAIHAGSKADIEKSHLKGLMEYQHIDPAMFNKNQGDGLDDPSEAGEPLESVLYDDALIRCLTSTVGHSHVAFLFAKGSCRSHAAQDA